MAETVEMKGRLVEQLDANPRAPEALRVAAEQQRDFASAQHAALAEGRGELAALAQTVKAKGRLVEQLDANPRAPEALRVAFEQQRDFASAQHAALAEGRGGAVGETPGITAALGAARGPAPRAAAPDRRETGAVRRGPTA
ncbi:hypothetical protein DEF28_24710 [Marinitenerispora sediminis]|uniref:Uncharacterized protein n=1 Tax=Marinitenerispora sediminis TaxID=1931232 RepID=A0A368SZF6_9ACTN|nr:hypothetical protein DEF28_24710 [Marinitenerispora sediminis]RCV51023.1 hypothetical protein DEF24_23645 [Marinitenerispora sediminis]